MVYIIRKLFPLMAAIILPISAYAQQSLPIPEVTLVPHTHASATFSRQTINEVLWPSIERNTAFPAVPNWYASATRPAIPTPKHTKFPPHLLTLRDAIWIALRNNPDVKNDEADRISQKFALAVAKWNFEPHFNDSFKFTRDMKNRKATLATSGGISLNTPFGTSITTGFNNATKSYFDHRNTYTASIKQPLMKGGWLTPWNAYLDSVSAEAQNKISFRSDIMDVVTSVISDFTGLVSDYNNLTLDEENLKETKNQLKQDQLKIKTGRMARSDYLQEAVSYQQDQLSLVQEQNNLQTSYQTFLTELGFVSTAHVKIDRAISTKGFDEPDLKTCIAVALKHNPQYLTDKLAVEDAKRGLTDAINGLMPQLDVTGDFGFGNGQSTSQSITLDLSVPIDDMSARQSEISAKIALEKAKIDLTTEKQTLISQIRTDWETVKSDKKQIDLSKKQVDMQAQVVKDNQLLLKYGRTTMYEFLQQRDSLLQNRQTFISNQTTYMNDVATLDSSMGYTLKRWNIKLRY